MPMSERLLLIMLLLLFTSGCAGLRLMWAQDPLGEIDEALAEEDLNRAYTIIEQLPRRHGQHEEVQAQRPRLEEKASAFEQQRIARAEELAAEERWGAAVDELDDALARWSHGEALQEARERIREQEHRALLGLRADLALAESRWLLREQERRELLDGFAAPAASEHRQRLTQRRESLSEELRYLAGELRDEDWTRVRHLMESALALSTEEEDEEDRALLEEAQKQLAEKDASRRARHQASLRERISDDLDRYAESNRIEDLVRARTHLGENPDDGLQEEYRKVRELVKQRVEQDIARGDSLYARGAYREALEHWKGLVPLAPEHEGLRSRLNRLERVLQSLERLEGS